MKENKYDSLLQAGFEIFELIEPQPNEVMLNTIPEMKDELRRPMMLSLIHISHAGREHGNNFRIFRQFRSKENNGNEYEQRTEQIREIGDKVHVIFTDDFTPRSFMLHKLVHLLVEVEHYCNRND